MRTGAVLLALLAPAWFLLSCAPQNAEPESSTVSIRERVRWEAPTLPWDSSSLRIRVVDYATGSAVSAQLCITRPIDTTLVVDTIGYHELSGLRPVGIWAEVSADGYLNERLIFRPTSPGRSQVTVRLLRDTVAAREAACRGWLADSP